MAAETNAAEANAPSTSPSTSASAPSITTSATSPSPAADNQDSDNDDDDDDFFGPASSPPTSVSTRTHHEVQSDIPQLRRIHVTNGYREGLSAAKETTLQTGFDEGFPVGAAAALKVGRVLGILQALGRSGRGEDREKVLKMLKAAQKELELKELLEVMNVEQERKSGDQDGDEQLVMEDVKFKEKVIEGWKKEIQRLLEGVVVE